MTKTDIGIYRGLKEKFDPEVHIGFFITADTGELLIGDQSLGQTISGWTINDGVLTLKLNTGKEIKVTFPEATETVKGLLSAADKAQLNALQDNLDSKVDKIEGKGLSTHDFTDILKTKLEGLTNYDDRELTSKLEQLESRLDTLVGSDDATAVIDTFQEIEAFLQDITNTETLTGLLQDMKDEITELVETNQAELSSQIETKANSADVYTKTQIDNKDFASKAHVNERFQQLIGAAPEALDTLEEIAAKLGDNDDVHSAIINSIAEKASKTELQEVTTANALLEKIKTVDGPDSGLDAASADKLTAKQLTNQDLNNIKDQNFTTYWAGTTNTCLNKPDNISWFGLQVFRICNATDICQIMTCKDGAHYTRWFNSTMWSPWRKILREDDVADHFQNNTPGLNHIPAGGHERQILAWKADGEAKWDDLANMFTGLEELLAYGVEWDVTVADPHLTRIGNMSLHKTLPIQSQLKGCIAQGDKIIYWLDEDNWKYKKGGNPDKGETEQLARLDGYDGTVRVYCPSFYIKSKIIGNKRQVWLSTVKIDNTWTYQPEILLDAYRCTVMTSVPENMGYLSTLPANSAISVVNTATYCRGGNNNTAYDKYLETDPHRTQLGKPRTYTPRSSMRTYARNAGNQMLSYDQYKNIFYWLYVVEYANFNCQEAYNAELTAEGYRQGGMGPGVTNWSDANWNNYNGYYPLTPCGYTNEFGNKTGTKPFTTKAGTNNLDAGTTAIPTVTSVVPRWRGFENPFGDIWTNLDGIIIDADADNHPNNMNYVYTCQDPSKFADALNDNYEKVGEEIHTDGYTKLFDLGEAAHIIPNVMGGNTTTYKCDYHWTGSKEKTPRTLLVGGGAYSGTAAGLGSFYSVSGVSYSSAAVGFRSVSSFLSFSQTEAD